MSGHADRALRARRVTVVEQDRLAGVVVDIDATEDPQALAVLQASLHVLAEGSRLGYGYDIAVVGLGEWIGDRALRILLWPAVAHEDGDIDAADPSDPDADVLVIDLDTVEHEAGITTLARLGRLLVAGPEAGPVPLVVDLDRDLLADAIAELRRS